MSSDQAYNLCPDIEAEFLQLQNEGKALAKKGKINEALEAMKKALSLCYTEKLARRVEKLETFLQECEDGEADPMIEVGKGFYLYHELYKKLYSYQKDGILWLWKLFKKQKGGVLGDDMGLGKTIQIIAFLSGMFDAELIKSVLIVMPVSLMPVWEKEFDKWAPGICLYGFYSSCKREGEKNIRRVQQKGGVIITSYGMIVNSYEYMSEVEGRKFIWDYLILDEGHKIKNPTKTTKAVHCIPSKNRIVLTGTPIQNNLRELWALYDFVHQGALLGSLHTFKVHYETPITRAREKDASAGERRLGVEIAENLKHLIAPYFLRRTKSEVLQKQDNEESSKIYEPVNDENKSLFSLARKNDFITWIFLSPLQLQIYHDFLKLDMVKNILMSKRSPLVELTILKKICDHPRLLNHRACIQLGLNGAVSEEELETTLQDESATTMSIDNISDDTLIEESGKLAFLLKLLENLRSQKHRTLIFSQSRKILDIIQRILKNRQWKVMRIDGTITKIEDREKNIQHFQRDPSYCVFLLTTQVGGVGLTLTEADRVIIYDPSWNPATDAQAVDRVYRIGQSKSVVIYRLITCGTVEEKIYRRQIFKDSITRQATGGAKDPHRYFTKQELRELFTVDNPHHSSTQVQLEQIHSGQRKTDTSLDEHIAFLYSLNIFGISDHDLMFSKEISDNEEDSYNTYVADDYIKQKVEMARQVVQVEANQMHEDNIKSGTYARPYTVPVTSIKRSYVPDPYKPPFLNKIDSNDRSTINSEVYIENEVVDIQDSSCLLPAFNDKQESNILPMAVNVAGCEKTWCDNNSDEEAQLPILPIKNIKGDENHQNVYSEDNGENFIENKENIEMSKKDCQNFDNCKGINEISCLRDKFNAEMAINSNKNKMCPFKEYSEKNDIRTSLNNDIHYLNESLASVVITSDSDNSLNEDLTEVRNKASDKSIHRSFKKSDILVPDSDNSKDLVQSANTSFDMFVADSDDDIKDDMSLSDACVGQQFVNAIDAHSFKTKISNGVKKNACSFNKGHSNVKLASSMDSSVQKWEEPLNEDREKSDVNCQNTCKTYPMNSGNCAEMDDQVTDKNSPSKPTFMKELKPYSKIKRRIIPLRLQPECEEPNITSSPFQKALSLSIEVSPDVKTSNCMSQDNSGIVSASEDIDSPIQIVKKVSTRRAITSESEDSEDNSSMNDFHDTNETESCEEEDDETSYEDSASSFNSELVSD